MPDRPDIPGPIERDLMIEAGYGCAVCKTRQPLVIDHIEEWAKVKAHEFANLIVLCANCHGLKKNSSDPRHINRASLRKIKQNLMFLNGRYSDLERRIIDRFIGIRKAGGATARPYVTLHNTMELLIQKLAFDGFVSIQVRPGAYFATDGQGVRISDDQLLLIATDAGIAFLDELATVREP
jgi:HNH endonuclease